MQAVACTQSGPPEVLRILDVPDPIPGPGQVRIRVKVRGGNFRAIGVRRDGTLVPRIASGAVEPYITGVYAWEQAPEAHRLLEGRQTQGKLALVHPN